MKKTLLLLLAALTWGYTAWATDDGVSDTVYACDSYLWHVYDTTFLFDADSVHVYSYTDSLGRDLSDTLVLHIGHSSPESDTVASECEFFVWHDRMFTESCDNGNWINGYKYRYRNMYGCDSIVSLNLTIKHNSSRDTLADACNTFDWYGNTYALSGNYYIHDINSQGCDSTVMLVLRIHHDEDITITQLACEPYAWHDSVYSVSTLTPRFDTVSFWGCDSTEHLHLSVGHRDTAFDTIIACDRYRWHNKTYLASVDGETWVGTNVTGCDSLVTLNLTVNTSYNYDTVVYACDRYTWGDTTVTSSCHLTTFQGTNVANCDSVRGVTIQLRYSTINTLTIFSCDRYRWPALDTIYTGSADTMMVVGTNVGGCDSVLRLNLMMGRSTTFYDSVTACDSYTWHGTTYVASTDTADAPQVVHMNGNAEGCDSTEVLFLTINQSLRMPIDSLAYDSLEWYGTTYYNSGVYTHVFTSSIGCDSIEELHLTIVPKYSVTVLTEDSVRGYTSGTGRYYDGTGVIIEAYSHYGYTFCHWSDGDSNNPRFLIVSKDTCVTAHFKPITIQVTIKPTDTLRADEVVISVPYMVPSEVNVRPNKGYSFSQWTDGNRQNPRTVRVAHDTVMYAELDRNKYRLRARYDETLGTVTGVGDYYYLDTVMLLAAAVDHYHFTMWEDSSVRNPRIIIMDTDYSVRADFGVDEYLLRGEVAYDSARGTVLGGGRYLYGSMVTMAAVPNYGYYFDCWADSATRNPRIIEVTSDTVLTACFAPLQYYLYVSAASNMGTVYGDGSYGYHANAEIGATPKRGYKFSHWDDGDTVNPRVVTVEGNASYVAYFERMSQDEEREKYAIRCWLDGNVLYISGVENMDVSIFDAIGNRMSYVENNANPVVTQTLLHSGVYFVKVADFPAYRIVYAQ